MKKFIVGLIVGLSLSVGVAHAAYVHQPGEWSEWWVVGQSGSVKRIYDHENKLVCWVYSGYYSGGIDCQPSLELQHPLTQ